MDLEDLAHNTDDGLHMASLAGAVLAAVAGFGGVRDYGGRLCSARGSRRGSSGWASRWRCAGPCCTCRIASGETRLFGCPRGLGCGSPHWGEEVTLGGGDSVELPIPPHEEEAGALAAAGTRAARRPIAQGLAGAAALPGAHAGRGGPLRGPQRPAPARGLSASALVAARLGGQLVAQPVAQLGEVDGLVGDQRRQRGAGDRDA